MFLGFLLSSLLPCPVHGLVKLATELGELPVIPHFEHAGYIYPVDSPSSLSGRAVAALFHYDPGYMQAWIPEAGAAEAEINAFRILTRYGESVAERWQLRARGLPDREHLTLHNFQRNPTLNLFSSLPSWMKLQNLHLVARDQVSAKKLLLNFLPHFIPLRDAFVNHLSAVEIPLIERLKGYFQEASEYGGAISNASPFFADILRWCLKEHDYFPTITSLGVTREDGKLLLDYGINCMHGNVNWLKETIDSCFGNQPFQFLSALYWKEVLLHNLQQPNPRSLNPFIVDLLRSSSKNEWCRLLVALHYWSTDRDLALSLLLQQVGQKEVMSAATRSYLRKTVVDLPAPLLVRYGFYDVEDFSDPSGILEEMKAQPDSFILADKAGFMKLTARLVHHLNDPSQLMGAPWTLHLCLLQANRMKKAALLAWLKTPLDPFDLMIKPEFVRWMKVNVVEMYQLMGKIVKIDTPQARTLIELVMVSSPATFINHFLVNGIPEERMIKLVKGLRRGEKNTGASFVSIDDLERWRRECLPIYRQYFEEWFGFRAMRAIRIGRLSIKQ